MFGMREKLKNEDNRNKLLKKLGYRTFSNCFSYLLSNKDYQYCLSNHSKVSELLCSYTKKNNLSEVFNFVKQSSEELLKNSNKSTLNLKLSFKKKTLLDLGIIHSRPFSLCSSWWLLAVSLDPTDSSIYRISLEYFKPGNPENFNLHHLKTILNLDVPGNTASEDCNIELGSTDIFSFESKMQALSKKPSVNSTPKSVLGSEKLKLVSRCILPSVIVLKASVLDLGIEHKGKKSHENSRNLIGICVEEESIEIGELPVSLTQDNMSIEVLIETNALLSEALTQILYSSIAGCKRPKKIDVSEFVVNSEQEILTLVKLFRYIYNGSEQDAALIISDYGILMLI